MTKGPVRVQKFREHWASISGLQENLFSRKMVTIKGFIEKNYV